MEKNNFYKKIGVHLGAWITYAIITYSWVASGFLTYEQSFFITFRIIALHISVFYINLYILLPWFMEKNRYVYYLISIAVMLLLFYFLLNAFQDSFPIQPEFEHTRRLRDSMIPEISGREYPPPRPEITPPVNPRIILNLVSSIAVLFIGTITWINQQANARLQKEARLKNENLQTELKLLKSQINPHFLFNALNNIYSLSFTKNRKAPEMIMKLSDMLRYVLYESNETTVPLGQEINYIQHYIDFQILKLENNHNITVKWAVVDEGVPVEPMLFIPFIENSFKHSNISRGDGWVEMHLEATENKIVFHIKNSLPTNTYTKDHTTGIGLENVKRRLRLLYPEKHVLNIIEDDEVFEVKLIVLV